MTQNKDEVDYDNVEWKVNGHFVHDVDNQLRTPTRQTLYQMATCYPHGTSKRRRERASRHFVEKYALAAVSLTLFHLSLFLPVFGAPVGAPRG